MSSFGHVSQTIDIANLCQLLNWPIYTFTAGSNFIPPPAAGLNFTAIVCWFLQLLFFLPRKKTEVCSLVGTVWFWSFNWLSPKNIAQTCSCSEHHWKIKFCPKLAVSSQKPVCPDDMTIMRLSINKIKIFIWIWFVCSAANCSRLQVLVPIMPQLICVWE